MKNSQSQATFFFFLAFLQTPMRAFPTNSLPLLLVWFLRIKTCPPVLPVLCGFFQQLKHKKYGSNFFNPTKRTQEIQTFKRTPFTKKFPANQLFARTLFSFLSFYVNICFFITFEIVLRFFLPADSAFLSEVAVNHLKKARGEIWPKRSERRNNTKTTKMRTKSPQ